MFTIKLTEDGLKIIDAALQALPYGQVSGLYNDIKNQIIEQSNQVVKENTEKDKSGAD